MNNTLLVKNILSQEAFFTLNKAVLKKHGLVVAGVLASYVEKMNYHNNKGSLHQGEWFYHTRTAMEHELKLSAYEQRQAVAVLTDLGILEIKKIGIPAKNYYRVNGEQLIKLLSELD